MATDSPKLNRSFSTLELFSLSECVYLHDSHKFSFLADTSGDGCDLLKSNHLMVCYFVCSEMLFCLPWLLRVIKLL